MYILFVKKKRKINDGKGDWITYFLMCDFLVCFKKTAFVQYNIHL